MGGYNAGEVASGIAVKTVMSLVKEAVEHQDMSSADTESGLARPSIVLRDAIARANKIIYQTAKTQPQCEGMGTTIVSCLFFDNRVAIAPCRGFPALSPQGKPLRADDHGPLAAAGAGRPGFLLAGRGAAGDK
jgi:hypothetical protein